MRDRPEDFDERDLIKVLADGWLIEPVIMEYAPVGFGDYHWTAAGTDQRRWFVKVADLDHKTHCGPDAAAALIGLERAMDTAAELALRPELDFVAGPVRGVDGRTVRPVGARYAVSVFPRLDAEPGTFDRKRTAAERADVIDLLARLHSARPPAATPIQPIDLTLRAVVLAALDPANPAPIIARPDSAAAFTEPVEGQAPVRTAPFRSAARNLIITHRAAIQRRLAEFDAVAATIPTTPEQLVITHGEPHPGNLLRDHGTAAAGGYHLIDWDTVGLAVPERDLAGIDAEPEDLDRYQAATGHRPDPGLITAYHLRWDLEEIGIYADQFRNDHDRSPDTELAWQGLVESVRRLATDGHD